MTSTGEKDPAGKSARGPASAETTSLASSVTEGSLVQSDKEEESTPSAKRQKTLTFEPKPSTNVTSFSKPKSSMDLGLGRMVQSEVELRKKESIGLALTGGGRKLGGVVKSATPPRGQKDEEWGCLVCTLSNEPLQLACIACGTPKGEAIWTDRPL